MSERLSATCGQSWGSGRVHSRHLYPVDWPVLSRRCRERAGWQCEHCGVRQGEERISRKGKLYKVVLQAAHLDHNDRRNPDAVLICLCFRCHWWHDFEQWVLEQERRLNDL